MSAWLTLQQTQKNHSQQTILTPIGATSVRLCLVWNTKRQKHPPKKEKEGDTSEMADVSLLVSDTDTKLNIWRRDAVTSLFVAFTCHWSFQFSSVFATRLSRNPFRCKSLSPKGLKIKKMPHSITLRLTVLKASWMKMRWIKLKSSWVRFGLILDPVTSQSLHHFSFLSESMSPRPGNKDVLVHSGRIFVWRDQRWAFPEKEKAIQH